MRRLVSLVPSITETLCAFGLQHEVVGCTSFCTHPSSLRHSASSVGGTKDARLEDILALKPTHVFVNEEENSLPLVAMLQEASIRDGFQVHISYPRELNDALELVENLGDLLGFTAAASTWRAQCIEALGRVHDLDETRRQRGIEAARFAYFIWRDPWMVAGNRTYISRLLAEAGFHNAFSTSDEPRQRYPAVLPGNAAFANPRLLLFFSSEPFPFRHRHIDEFLAARSAAWPREDISDTHTLGTARKVDGRLLSWYGVSTLAALTYLEDLHRGAYSP
ncbi:MAG: ABC transporter substrate-binding protein [Silvanigrellales bacterium]|nr:ABC transporter substrate-binding protein [Silvanigrellales bacterium]